MELVTELSIGLVIIRQNINKGNNVSSPQCDYWAI